MARIKIFWLFSRQIRHTNIRDHLNDHALFFKLFKNDVIF